MPFVPQYPACVSRRRLPELTVQNCPALLVAVFSLLGSGCSRLVDSDTLQCSSDPDCEQRGGSFAGSKCVDNFCRPAEQTASQCSIDQDCTQRGGNFVGSACVEGVCQGPWTCLDSVVWPASTSSSVTVTMNFSDIITGQPVSGVSSQACHKLDTTCASPVLRDLVSDSAGRVTFTIQSGFDGYLQSTSTGIMPFLYFFYPPLTSNRDIPAVPILQESALATFATLAGGTVMPNRGHALARAYNCLGKTAEGVRMSSPESDTDTTPFYMIKGIPSTKHSATDSSGNGGLLNLPPGTATLTGRLENGNTMGTLSVLTVAGRISYTALVPSPR